MMFAKERVVDGTQYSVELTKAPQRVVPPQVLDRFRMISSLSCASCCVNTEFVQVSLRRVGIFFKAPAQSLTNSDMRAPGLGAQSRQLILRCADIIRFGL